MPLRHTRLTTTRVKAAVAWDSRRQGKWVSSRSVAHNQSVTYRSGAYISKTAFPVRLSSMGVGDRGLEIENMGAGDRGLEAEMAWVDS